MGMDAPIHISRCIICKKGCRDKDHVMGTPIESKKGWEDICKECATKEENKEKVLEIKKGWKHCSYYHGSTLLNLVWLWNGKKVRYKEYSKKRFNRKGVETDI